MTLTDYEFRQVGATVGGWKKPIIFSHARPDGDALGGLLAMRSIFRQIGAEPTPILFDAVPSKYEWMVSREPIAHLDDPEAIGAMQNADGILIIDTCTYSQLEPVASWLREAKAPKLVVDHHVTHENIADEYLIDESASSACAILFDWAVICGQELDSSAARAIFVGIATDTGWFRFSNTDVRTLEIAAELVRRGVIPETLYGPLFESESIAKMRLFGETLGNIETRENDRVAMLTVTREMFDRTQTTPADTEDLINQAMRIGQVQVALIFVEADGGVIKVSLRSKGQVDVAAIAAGFGGGGHKRAAGARIAGTLENAKERIHAAVASALP